MSPLSDNDPAISIEMGKKRYILRLLDYRGSDDRILRQAMGMTVNQAWQEAAGGALDATAGLIWLMRVREEPQLKYEDVANSITNREFLTMRDATIDDIEALRADFEDREPQAVDINPEA